MFIITMYITRKVHRFHRKSVEQLCPGFYQRKSFVNGPSLYHSDVKNHQRENTIFKNMQPIVTNYSSVLGGPVKIHAPLRPAACYSQSEI